MKAWLGYEEGNGRVVITNISITFSIPTGIYVNLPIDHAVSARKTEEKPFHNFFRLNKSLDKVRDDKILA